MAARLRSLGAAAGRRPVLLLAAVAAVALVLAVVLVVRGCGGGGPSDNAAGLVPQDALVYAHLSTDRGSDQWRQAGRLVARFPSYPRVRDSLLGVLGASGGEADFRRDVQPWLGSEVAFALLSGGQGVAGSLILLAVTDEGKARAFLDKRAGSPRSSDYRGARLETYPDGIVTAFSEGFLLVGQDASIRAALDAGAGRHTALDGSPAFERAADGLPEDRFAFLYASSEGVRRLLAAQGGLPALVAALVDSQDLVSSAAALQAEQGGFRLTVQRALQQESSSAPPKQFEPSLAASVPAGALVYLGSGNVSRTAQTLVAGAAGATGPNFSRVFDAVKANLRSQTGVDLDKDVLPLLSGEAALFLTPTLPAPVGTLIIKQDDPLKANNTLKALQPALAKVLTQRGRPVRSFVPIEVSGTRAYSLRISRQVELTYAIVGDRLVISTSSEGIRSVRENGKALTGEKLYQEALGDLPNRVSAVVFLNLAQLLRLGDQTALARNPAYLAVSEDLKQVAAVGVASTASEDLSRVELFFDIS